MRNLCTHWPRRPHEMGIIAGRPFDQSNPDHVDWERYGKPGAKDRVLWVGASRGCAFQCRFCVEPQRGAAYSRYTVDDTLDIIERLVQSHNRVSSPSPTHFSARTGHGPKRSWQASRVVPYR